MPHLRGRKCRGCDGRAVFDACYDMEAVILVLVLCDRRRGFSQPSTAGKRRFLFCFVFAFDQSYGSGDTPPFTTAGG